MSAVAIAAIAGLPATLVALATLVTAMRANRKVQALHVVVNSRLTQLLALTAKASRAEGVASVREGSTGPPRESAAPD